MTTSLVLYGTTVASSTLSTANKLVTSSGGTSTSKTTTASDNAGTNQYYMEVFSQGGTAGDSASITAPTGKGFLFDVTTLETNTIDAGNWSAVLKMNDTSGFTAITMIIRAYVYNGGTYTAISTMQVTGQSMSSTTTTYNIANTSFPAQAFRTGDKLYLDLWLKPTTGHWAGDPIVNFSSSSSSAGVTGQFVITTPGYDPTAVTNTWTANDVGLTPSDSMVITPATNVVFPADTLICSDSIQPTVAYPLGDNATGLTENATFIVVAVPIDPQTITETVTTAINVANIIVLLSTFDTLGPSYVYLTYYFLLDVPPPTLSDTLGFNDAPSLFDTMTASDSTATYGAVFASDSLTEVETGLFQAQFVDTPLVTVDGIMSVVSVGQSDTFLIVSDIVSDSPTFIPTDTLSVSDIFATSSASYSNFVDTLVADDSASGFVLSCVLPDVALTVVDAAINPTMTVLEQMIQTETCLLTDSNVLSDVALSQTETDTLAVFVSVTDSVLSTTDSVVGVSVLVTGYATKTFDYDNFTRTTSSGVMGTADSGSAWTFRDNTNNTFNVTGSFLQVKASSGTGSFDNYLGSTSTVDVDVTASFKFTALDGTLAKVFGRGSATTSHISAGFQNSTTFNVGTDSNSTQIGTKSVSLTANTKYWIRLCIQGSFVGAKYWADGTAEPAAWTIQGTQTTYTGAGYCGFYVNAAGTTNYCQVDDYAIRDYRLADSVGLPVPPDVVSVSVVATCPTDTTSTTDTLVSQSTTVVSLTDIVLSTTDTTTDTLVSVQTDIVLSATDTLVGYSFQPTMSVVDVLSVADSATSFTTSRTLPTDTVATSDIVSATDIPSPVDVLSVSETLSDAMSVSLSDVATVSDSGVGIFSRAYLLSDTGSEFVLSDSVSSYVSSYSYLELSAVTEAVTFTIIDGPFDVTTFGTDNIFAASPAPLPDIPLSIAEAISPTLALSDSTQITASDAFVSSVAQTIADQVTSSDTQLLTEQLNDSFQLTISDTIIGGVPSNFTADTLGITDNLVHGGLFPFIDQLATPIDFLGVRTNFTDNIAVFETIVITQSNALLDARSVLYTNTISDSPSAYYQLNEDAFGGIYQKDGNTQPNNASNPTLIGATLEYTWAQLEPQEGNILWSIIDTDILPWENQAKRVIIRVTPSSTALYNDTHNASTAQQATPQWVFDAGAPKITSPFDASSYPVYWDTTFTSKFTAFIQALGLRYDTSSTVSGVVVALGVRGTTALEASGDSAGNTLALWTPVGYTPDQWVTSITWAIDTYQLAFVHTPLILSVNNAFIVPNSVYNMDTMISIAVTQGVWLMDENVFVGEAHNNPNWNIVPLISVPAHSGIAGPDTVSNSLALALDYQSDYTSVWAADVTTANQATLTSYSSLVAQKGLNDSATNGFKMQIIGGVYPTSHISTGDYLNGAQQFDGITGYGLIQSTAQTTTAAWTLKATIYPTVLPTQEAIIACIGRDGSSGYGGYAIGISGGSSGGSGASFCAFFPGIGWYDSGFAFPQANQWYSLFCSWDGLTLSFYVNGILCPNTYSVTAFGPQADMTIGAIWDGMTRLPKRFFIGSIDEVAVYPYALNPTRILALSSAEVGLSDGPSGSTGVSNFTDSVAIDDSLSTFTDIRMYSDISLVPSDLITSHNASTNSNAYTVLALDNFNRTVSAGSIGVETDGKTWSRLQGTSTISVDGSRAVINGTATLNVFSVVGTNGTKEEGILRYSSSVNSSTIGITFRTVDGNNFYALRYSGGALQLVKFISNVATTMATLTIATTANTKYWLRFRAIGTTLQGMMWADGLTEGSAWQIAATDATYTSGGVGMYVLPTVNTNVWIDQYYVIDNPLTDFVLVGDALLIGVAPTPFVDAASAPVDASSTMVEQDETDVLNEAETSFTVVNATGIDFLLYTFAPLSESFVYSPVDQSTATDIVSTPVIINVPVDTLGSPTDGISFTPNWLQQDTTAPLDFFAESLSSVLSDTPTIIDATTLTGVNLCFDSVATSDSMVFTGVMLDIIQQSMSETLFDMSVFAPTEQTPVSDMSVSTVATTDIVVGLATVETCSVATSFVPSDTPVATEQIMSALSQTYVFINVGVADTMSVGVADTMSDVATPVADTMSGVATVSRTDQLVPSDVATPTDTFVGQDIPMSQSETCLSVVGQTLSDSVATTDSVSDTLVEMSQDSVATTDIVSDTLVEIFFADTPLATDSILVATSEIVTDIPLSVTDMTLTTVVQAMSDTLVFVDNNAFTLALSVTDTSTFGETQVDIVYEMAADSVATSDTFSYAQAFVPVDIQSETETLFVATAESLSDTITVQEVPLPTVTNFATDNLSPPIDSLAKADLFVFEDDLLGVELFSFTENKVFLPDSATANDAITSSNANTFTGWLDVLLNVESVLYTTAIAAFDVQSEIETIFAVDAETVQDSSTPSSESFAVVLTAPALDTGVLSDTFFATESVSESYSLLQAEINAVTTYARPVDTGVLSESFSLSLSQNTLESVIFSDVSTSAVTHLIIDYTPVGFTSYANAVAVAPNDSIIHSELVTVGVAKTMPADALTATEGIPTVGYALIPDTLSIVETGQLNRVSYLKIFAVMKTGTVDAIVTTGKCDSFVHTGQVEGEIP